MSDSPTPPYEDILQMNKDLLVSLTLWEKGFSAQQRERCLVLFFYSDESHQEGVQVEVELTAARHLRDLLNMATARGFL